MASVKKYFKKLFKKRSKLLFASNVLATIFILFICYVFISIFNSVDKDFGGGDIVFIFFPFIPYMFFTGLGSLVNWISFFTKKAGISVLGSILLIFGLFCAFPFVFLGLSIISLIVVIVIISIVVLGLKGSNEQFSLYTKK